MSMMFSLLVLPPGLGFFLPYDSNMHVLLSACVFVFKAM